MKNILKILFLLITLNQAALAQSYGHGSCSEVADNALVRTYNMAITCPAEFTPGTTPRDTLYLVDTRSTPFNTATQNPGRFSHPDWNIDTIGNVYLTEFDLEGNIYVPASRINFRPSFYLQYGSLGATGGANPAGAIYKLDAVTGAATLWASLPQDPTIDPSDPVERGALHALGGITYDRVTNSMYVVNRFDNTIYQLNGTTGATISTYTPDPMVLGEANGFQAAPFGLDVYNGRLYYTVQNAVTSSALPFPSGLGMHQGQLVVRSVAINANGSLNDTTDTLDVTQQITRASDAGFRFAYYSGDIDFSQDGRMLVGGYGTLDTIPDSPGLPNWSIVNNHFATNFAFQNTAGTWTLDKITTVGQEAFGIDDYQGSSLGTVAFNPYPYNEDIVWSAGGDFRGEDSNWGIVGYDYNTLGNTFVLETSSSYYQFLYDSPQAAGTEPGDPKGFGGEVDVFTCAPVQIGNRVWIDTNQDGLQDATDVVIVGATVSLLDAVTGAVLDTAITDANGEYVFEVAPDTNFKIALDNPVDYLPGGPLFGLTVTLMDQGANDFLDSDAMLMNGFPSIMAISPSLVENQATITPTFDFGLAPAVEIGDYIWNDANMDGIQDASEAPIPGVVVSLLDSAGAVLGTTVTDVNGEYSFSVPPNLNFTIKLDNPVNFAPGGPLDGFSLTLQDAGTDDLLDSDAIDMGGVPAIMLTSPATGQDLSFDFGFNQPVQIGNFVWFDANGNGIQDVTEAGIIGVTVSLFDKTTNAFVSSVLTDVNGRYLFDVAPDFNFTIKLDNPADYAPGGALDGLVITFQDAGADDLLDSDAMDMSGFAAVMGVSPLIGSDLSFDLGFTDVPVSPIFPGVATGPTFFFWNTNLDIQNISSMLNGGGSFFDSVLTTFSNDGSFNAQTGTWLYPDGNSDVVLSGLPANSFGIGQMDLVPTTSASTYDGLIAQYRFAPDGNEIEFAKFSPYIQSTSGTKYLTYNTFQPSMSPAQAANQVTVWTQVANPDPILANSYTVNVYTTAGALASSQNITVPPLGRVDVESGHIAPGASNQGLVEVIPANPTAPFITQVSRYGADAPAGVAPPSFSFATANIGNSGFTSEIVAPVSSGGGAQNWAVVTNTAAVPTTAQVEFINYTGNVLQSSTVPLPANGQATFDAASLFPGGTSGVVKVTPLGAEPIIADSMFYFYKPDGTVSAAYISQAEPNYALPKYGSYNTFLGQQNWLKLFNDNSTPVNVTVSVNQIGSTSPAIPLGSTTITLAPQSGIDAELIGTLGLSIPVDTIGTVEVSSASSGVYAEILRLRPLNGYIDLAKAVPVR